MVEPGHRDDAEGRQGAVQRFEWMLARFLVATRLVAVLTVVADVRAGRGQLRRPRLAAAVAGLTVLHASWAISRTVRQRRIGDPLVAASEIPLGVALVAVEALVYDIDAAGAGTGPRFGTDYVGVAAGLAGAEFASRSWMVTSITGLVAAKLTIAVRARERKSVTVQGTLFDLLVMAEGLMAHVIVTRVRAQAVELERAHEEKTLQTAGLAGEREQLRHHRLVHDRVLQTLEIVAGRWDLDDEHIRQRLRLESDQLQELIEGGGAGSGSDLIADLHGLVREFSLRDLQVEVCSDVDRALLIRSVLDGLLGATREALANVCKHAGVDRAAVTVREYGGWLAVTVTDSGRGFDASAADGFGLTHSVRGRLDEIGGTVAVVSTQGVGTNVVMRVPR